jgi:PAS domain S-box-containing protein
MLTLSRRAWIGSAAGASLVAALYAGLDALRGLAAGAWPVWLAGAGLTFAVLLGVLTLMERRHRQQLQRLADRLGGFRNHPDARPLADSLTDGPFRPVAEQLEALAGSYRKALGDLAGQHEALESLRAQLGSADADRAPRKTVLIQRGSGSSRNMVARLTPSLHWIAATPALQQFLGWRQADLNARPLFEVVHPADVPALRRAFQEALEIGEAHNVTFRAHCRPMPPAGADPREPQEPAALRERHLQMDVVTRYAEGAPPHFRCFLIDTTDRVRAEQELRRRGEELAQSNERLLRSNQDLERLKESYRDLYHNAPVMYFSLDPDGQLVTFNNTLLDTLGYDREDLYRQPYTRLLPPESRERYPHDAESYRQQAEVETRWLKKDGTVIDVWIRSEPLLDADGSFIRSRSVAQDVTERNRLADEHRRRGDDLERANAELRQINKELDDFTSVVSHDLKEPLRTLDAFGTSLAQDYSTRLGPDGFECVNHLVMASRRLGKLIDDLLTLCWAGRLASAPRPFNLTEAVATVRRDLADLITRKGASVLTEGSLPTVVADPERVTQLLANLVGNGLKYHKKKVAPRVVIGEVRGPLANGSDGDFVTLYVRDNGIGIDPTFHQQIFGVFRRLHQRDEYEGTGAGLAICKKIVEAHAGRIWVESVPDQGSTFYFTLPRTRAGDAARPSGVLPQRASATRVREAAGTGGRRTAVRPRGRLLLVEDMPEIGLIVKRLTRHSGHTVEWVTSAEEAWVYLQGHRPDLVLLDIHLPGMNGIEFCRQLRTLPEQARVPVALFSQAANPEDLKAGLAAGANFVLSKDLLCQPETWRLRVDEMLTGSSP